MTIKQKPTSTKYSSTCQNRIDQVHVGVAKGCVDPTLTPPPPSARRETSSHINRYDLNDVNNQFHSTKFILSNHYGSDPHKPSVLDPYDQTESDLLGFLTLTLLREVRSPRVPVRRLFQRRPS
jgi:hypothetical protein